MDALTCQHALTYLITTRPKPEYAVIFGGVAMWQVMTRKLVAVFGCDCGVITHTAGACSKKLPGTKAVGFSGSGFGSVSKLRGTGQNNGKIILEEANLIPSRPPLQQAQLLKHFLVLCVELRCTAVVEHNSLNPISVQRRRAHICGSSSVCLFAPTFFISEREVIPWCHFICLILITSSPNLKM